MLHHAHSHVHAMPGISVPPWSLNCCDEVECQIRLRRGEVYVPEAREGLIQEPQLGAQAVIAFPTLPCIKS